MRCTNTDGAPPVNVENDARDWPDVSGSEGVEGAVAAHGTTLSRQWEWG